MKTKVVAVVGPTASGKTALSIKIAKQCNGEVISCDSRQVYKNLDIGTAKVTSEEMAKVPHHLLDVRNVNTVYTANDFKTDANEIITEIIERGNVPVIAGGTFFYLDQVRGRNLAPEVPKNNVLRGVLEKCTTEELHEKLMRGDPKRAAVIDKHNRRRLIRSLEIVAALGSVPAQPESVSDYEWLIVGINVTKETLLQRFKERAAHWLDTGIVDETIWLTNAVSEKRFSEFGFEYTVTKEYIDGKISEGELKKRYIEKNWQYAKRQMTWLKRDEEIIWVTPEEEKHTVQMVKDFLEK